MERLHPWTSPTLPVVDMNSEPFGGLSGSSGVTSLQCNGVLSHHVAAWQQLDESLRCCLLQGMFVEILLVPLEHVADGGGDGSLFAVGARLGKACIGVMNEIKADGADFTGGNARYLTSAAYLQSGCCC